MLQREAGACPPPTKLPLSSKGGELFSSGGEVVFYLAMNNEFSYLALVLRKAGSLWWEFIWSNSILSGLLAGAVAVALFFLAKWFPSLKPFVGGDAVDNFWEFTKGGIGPLIAIGLACGIVFLVCLALSPPAIYHEQIAEKKKIAQTLEEANRLIKQKDDTIKSQLPELAGEVRSTMITTLTSTTDEERWLLASFYVVVKNTGQPSIAEGWRAQAELPNGKTLFGAVYTFSGDAAKALQEAIPYKAASQNMFNLDRQILKVSREPIQNGALASGYLIVRFSSPEIAALSNEEVDATKFTVDFSDIHGKRHECTYSKHAVPITPEMPVFQQGDL
jgi:hypothetical protein